MSRRNSYHIYLEVDTEIDKKLKEALEDLLVKKFSENEFSKVDNNHYFVQDSPAVDEEFDSGHGSIIPMNLIASLHSTPYNDDIHEVSYFFENFDGISTPPSDCPPYISIIQKVKHIREDDTADPKFGSVHTKEDTIYQT